jgi:nucleoside-diphosphate-sugar epimerase
MMDPDKEKTPGGDGTGPRGDREIEEWLSRPTAGAVAAVGELDGDFMVLGASGKMGISLAAMIRRSLDAAGRKDARVFGVARFRAPGARTLLESFGVEPVKCDLGDYEAVMRLPAARNIEYLAGQKFGTASAPDETWMENTVVPSHVARRYAGARIVVFSTGCVYPFFPVDGPGARENSPLGFLGEYATTCVGRERVFTHYSRHHGTRMLLFRLNYSVEVRYGVLVDIGLRVMNGEPVDVSMAALNVIWQGDACARAIQSLRHVASPPKPLNVTGGKLSVRLIAEKFGVVFGRPPVFTGEPQGAAWHVDAAESFRRFGPPAMDFDAMVTAVAGHLGQGGRLLGKPTHFEVRNGRF